VSSIRGAALVALALGCAALGTPATDPHTIRGERNFVSGYPALRADGHLNAVIEIPAGTNAKWETIKSGEVMRWERKDGALRVVRYLPYPANYGMIPGTLLPDSAGGDGDPLDVVVLGPSLARGSVVVARPVGVLRLTDDGERDDKILAVIAGGPLADAQDLADLDAHYPGVTTILETWFTRYKGPGRTESRGFGDRAEALRVLEQAAGFYAQKP
jgi:inorganic pyrophosphatase